MEIFSLKTNCDNNLFLSLYSNFAGRNPEISILSSVKVPVLSIKFDKNFNKNLIKNLIKNFIHSLPKINILQREAANSLFSEKQFIEFLIRKKWKIKKEKVDDIGKTAGNKIVIASK
jgi:hypothetical protein